MAIIIGSTRNGRFGPTVAGWFAGRIRNTADLDTDVIDLAEVRLPETLTDHEEPLPRPVRDLAPRLAAADAFVVVTPEYNQSFPASLKTAIDWFYEEWQAKPVAFISYGRESGGMNAVAQLRQVFTELHAVPLRDGVGLPCYWNRFAADGSWPKPSEETDAAVTRMLHRIRWWGHALRDARAEHSYTLDDHRLTRAG